MCYELALFILYYTDKSDCRIIVIMNTVSAILKNILLIIYFQYVIIIIYIYIYICIQTYIYIYIYIYAYKPRLVVISRYKPIYFVTMFML